MDISNLGNLSVKEWIEILGEHPELEEKCDKFDDFSDFDWLALYKKPLFAEKFDEYRANYANTWVQILKTSPERASECDCWKEIAKCAYRGFVKTEYLSLFAIRNPEILAFVESESPELKQEVLGNIDRIKNSEALKFLLKNAIPMPQGVFDSIYDNVDFDKIFRLSLNNKEILSKSKLCGCYHCGRIFSPNKVEYYMESQTEQTAMCPFCEMDAVIPSTDEFPITEEKLSLLGAISFGSLCGRLNLTFETKSTKYNSR